MTSPSRFLTPISELRAHLQDRRPERVRDRIGVEKFLSSRFRERKQDLSLLSDPDRDFSSWKKMALDYLSRELIVPDSLGKPSDARLVRREEFDDYCVEHLEISVTPPLRAPATVVIPKRKQKKYPALVLLHSMGSLFSYGREKLLAFENEPAYLTAYRQDNYEGRSLQAEFARAGYLSIAIDAFNFGLRSPQAIENAGDFDQWRHTCTEEETVEFMINLCTRAEPQAIRMFECLGISLAAVVATDDLRTVDYLCTREDVDAERIACSGLSFGSFRTNYLSALDPRIKAAASVCWLSTLAGIVDYNVLGSMGFFALPPGVYRRMDMADIVALSAPKPFLALSGWQDVLMQPFGIAEAHLFYREAWQRAKSGNLGSLVYKAPHEYNRDMQEAAADFFARHLS